LLIASLSQESVELAGRDQAGPRRELQPEDRFFGFLDDDPQLRGKFPTRARPARCVVVGGDAGATPEHLIGHPTFGPPLTGVAAHSRIANANRIERSLRSRGSMPVGRAIGAPPVHPQITSRCGRLIAAHAFPIHLQQFAISNFCCV
jgi:hypothetical protein